MNEIAMAEVAKWGNFYSIMGSAAGALIGLQFVVLTLVAQRPTASSPAAGAAFGSPTVVHFGVSLFLSMMMRAPWETISIPAAVWGSLGIGGVLYGVIVVRRLRAQSAYAPVFEDWLCHAVLPFAAYVTLVVSWVISNLRPRPALFGVGSAALLLLFVGIHNAWDGVSYHVLVQRPAREREEKQNTAKKLEEQ